MSTLLDRLAAAGADDDVVVEGDTRTLTRAGLVAAVRRLATTMAAGERIALLADNGPDWIVADLAALHAGACLVPLPGYFADAQVRQCLASSGATRVIGDQPAAFDLRAGNAGQWWPVPGTGLQQRALRPAGIPALPAGTSKITYTSGSTGTPRGVCLDAGAQLQVADAIIATLAIERPRHLTILPLATLLENIAGVYAPLLAGGALRVPGLAAVGLAGSSSLDVLKLVGAVNAARPHTLILVPQLLVALLSACQFGWVPPEELAFIAVGGGKVAPGLVDRARAAGLPAYEGYGLTECASVVTLNRPGAQCPGSAGPALPNVRISVRDGELVVHGRCFLGYLDDPAGWHPEEVATGDLGHVDAAGNVHITGRRKNVQITTFGRNIAPEWIESELLATPVLSQAVVFAEAQPGCTALLAALGGTAEHERVARLVESVNATLPDYARVRAWLLLDQPMTAAAGLYTANGRPRRDAIRTAFATELATLAERLQATSPVHPADPERTVHA